MFADAQARRAYDEEAIRPMNAVARGVDSHGRGAVALKSYLGGAKQTVTVTHVDQRVQVNSGGQAVVAGGDAEAGKPHRQRGRKPRARVE